MHYVKTLRPTCLLGRQIYSKCPTKNCEIEFSLKHGEIMACTFMDIQRAFGNTEFNVIESGVRNKVHGCKWGNGKLLEKHAEQKINHTYSQRWLRHQQSNQRIPHKEKESFLAPNKKNCLLLRFDQVKFKTLFYEDVLVVIVRGMLDNIIFRAIVRSAEPHDGMVHRNLSDNKPI